MNGPVAIILAAGQGKRMKSAKAKVLHEVCGQPMIRYVVDAARGAGATTIVVVVGYAADQVRSYLGNEPDILFAGQTEQLEYLTPGGQAITYELRIVSISSKSASAASVKSLLGASSKAGRELLRREGLMALPGLRYSTEAGLLVLSGHSAFAGH